MNLDYGLTFATRVTEEIILEFFRGWRPAFDETLKEFDARFQEMLMGAIGDAETGAMRAYPRTELMKEAHRIVRSFYLEHMGKAWELVLSLLEGTRHSPVLHSKGSFKQRENAMKRKLLAARDEARVDEHYDRVEEKFPNKVSALPFPEFYQFTWLTIDLQNFTNDKTKNKTNADWKAKTLGADGWENEVLAMVTPLAYYDLVAEETVNVTARHLQWALLDRLKTELQPTLEEELRVGDENHCLFLLAQNPERERKRKELLAEQDKLLRAQKSLEELGVVVGVDEMEL
jgi:hypothetical protein